MPTMKADAAPPTQFDGTMSDHSLPSNRHQLLQTSRYPPISSAYRLNRSPPSAAHSNFHTPLEVPGVANMSQAYRSERLSKASSDNFYLSSAGLAHGLRSRL